jgi:adenine-specific DNA-methyltransferase
MQKFDAASHDMTADRLHQLREVYPEAFTEQGVDFDRLKELLGEAIETGPERYSFTWPGKTDAIRAAQESSMGTLVPDKQSSVDWDTTKNLYLEGDNLEILKLLQKSYTGKVKMIYIDPPYNTGGDFVYPDKYGEGLKTYLEYTGQLDGEGKKLTTNTETDGRYHSKWLNMMYPRLMLARNLLKDDGVIFVSIDDHEVHNLRKIMDEVFGPENLISQFIWEKRVTRENRSNVSIRHDYILAYLKNASLIDVSFGLMPMNSDAEARYDNPDADIRGNWTSAPATAQAGHGTKSQFYEFVTPGGRTVTPPPGRCWLYTRERMEEEIKKNNIWFGKDGKGVPRIKKFLSEGRQGLTPESIWWAKEVGTNDSAKRDLLNLFDGVATFDTPKPVGLLKRMLQIATDHDSVVLDYFSGSGTLGQALFELNAENGGNRQFILSQIQEPIADDDRSEVSVYKHISEIGRERIRRAGVKVREEYAEKLTERVTPLDTGFKTYRLTSSTFNVWDVKKDDNIEQKLFGAESLIRPDSKDEDVLTELILKSGYGLTEQIDVIELEGKKLYSVAGGKLVVSLGLGLTLSVVRHVADMNPAQFVAREHGFDSDDTLTNAAQIMKDKGIDFRVL